MKSLYFGKKAYFYTLAILFFVGIFLAVFFVSTDVLSPVTAHRLQVQIMNDFLLDLHHDLERVAFITGFRALIAMENHVATTGTYIDDVTDAFTQAFINGTIDTIPYSIMENATFIHYVNSVALQARTLGLILTVSTQNISLYHISPWEVAVDYELVIYLSNPVQTTWWNYTYELAVPISVYGLRDPVYSVETNSKATNTIRTYPDFSEFVNDTGDANDTTVLAIFLDKSYYHNSAAAPSFLMRFMGNNSASVYGIESLVNVDKLGAQELPLYTARSVVDYLYFFNITSATNCNVQNMPTYFKLDDAHRDVFEITTELTYNACS